MIYCFLLDRVGFIIATFLYVFGMMYILKNRYYGRMISVSLGISLGFYFIFARILNVNLPAGLLGNLL